MILLKKAVRSVWRGKRSYIACIVLLALGITMYVAYGMMHKNLVGARDSMYESQRFAHVFASVQSASVTDAMALESLEGIAEVDARLSHDARVLMEEGDGKLVTLRLLSYNQPEAGLNRFLITEGALPLEGEVLVGEAFALAHGLSLGDTVTVVLMGREVDWAIAGTVQSPDYVYTIPDTGQLLPDTAAFGMAYLPYQALASHLGKTGFVNDISFLLEDHVDFDGVKFILEDALTPFGLRSLYGAEDQASNAMLETEITSMASMTTSIPMVFVLMAVIILYIMLKRVIEQERTQIGTLKAFGYSNSALLGHYLLYGLLTGGLGGGLGLLLGALMATAATDIFQEFFYMPSLHAKMEGQLLLKGMALALGAGAFGAYMGARSIVRLLPGEAMRPQAPRIVSRDILEHIPLVRAALAYNGQMAVRNIARNRFRSLFVVCGVAFSFSIMAFMASYGEMMDSLTVDQFTHVQRYDLKVTLLSPAPATDAVESVYRIPGIRHAEGLMEVPAQLRLGHRREDALITALPTGGELYRIYDSEGDTTLPPPTGGAVLSASLAEKLRAVRGDTLLVKTLYTGDREFSLPVLEVVTVNMGAAVYIELGALSELLELPRTASSVLVRTDDAAAVKERFADAANVGALTDVAAEKKVYDDMLGSYQAIMTMLQVAGAGIAFAIITNTASISMSERKREYATLRVLGMHPKEIAAISGFEFWLLGMVGMAAGLPLTRLIKMGLAGMIDADLFNMPVETDPASFLAAAVGCAVAVLLSGLSTRRNIAKLDMVEVLKERE